MVPSKHARKWGESVFLCMLPSKCEITAARTNPHTVVNNQYLCASYVGCESLKTPNKQGNKQNLKAYQEENIDVRGLGYC